MRRPLSPPWTEDDVQKLKELVEKGEAAWRMGRTLHRSESAIRNKMFELGLKLPSNTLTLRRMRKTMFNPPSDAPAY